LGGQDGDDPREETPWNTVYLALYEDLKSGAMLPSNDMVTAAANAVAGFETEDPVKKRRKGRSCETKTSASTSSCLAARC